MASAVASRWRALGAVFLAAAAAGLLLGRLTASDPGADLEPELVDDGPSLVAPGEAEARATDAGPEAPAATACASEDAGSTLCSPIPFEAAPTDSGPCPGSWPAPGDQCGGGKMPVATRFERDGDGGAPQGRSEAWAFARYHDLEPMPIADETLVNGLPLKLAVLHTPDDVATVTTYYVERFEREGLQPIAGKMNPEGTQAYVTFHPGKGPGLAIISLVTDPQGTQVFAGTSEEVGKLFGSKLNELPPDVPTPVPPENALVSEFREAGQRHRSITFTLRAITPEAALKFYDAELGRRGFQTISDSVLDDGASHGVAYESSNQQVTLTMAPNSEGTLSVVMVWVER